MSLSVIQCLFKHCSLSYALDEAGGPFVSHAMPSHACTCACVCLSLCVRVQVRACVCVCVRAWVGCLPACVPACVLACLLACVRPVSAPGADFTGIAKSNVAHHLDPPLNPHSTRAS